MSMPTALECVSLFLIFIGMFAGLLALACAAEHEKQSRKEIDRYGWK